MKKTNYILALCFIFYVITGNIRAQSEDNSIQDKYAGKIVFAGSEINFDNLNEDFLKQIFTMDDDIYARVFMEKPLAEFFDEHNWAYDFQMEKFDYNYATDIYVDGEKKISWLDELPQEMFNKNTIVDIVIVPSEKDRFRYSVIANDWADMISTLEEGEHEIKVEFKARTVENPGYTVEPVSTGTFTYIIDSSKMDEFKRELNISLPEATIIDEEVEEGVLVATKNMYENMTPVKAVIIEPSGEFQYRRDENDNVLDRSFIAAVAFEGFDGNCYVRTARYEQEHEGNFQFGHVRLSQKLQGYLNYEIPCDNVYE